MGVCQCRIWIPSSAHPVTSGIGTLGISAGRFAVWLGILMGMTSETCGPFSPSYAENAQGSMPAMLCSRSRGCAQKRCAPTLRVGIFGLGITVGPLTALPPPPSHASGALAYARRCSGSGSWATPAVQVCPREVRLIVDGAAIQTLPLASLLPNPADADDEDLVIAAAEVAGAFLLLALGDGSAVILEHSAESGGRELSAHLLELAVDKVAHDVQ